MLTNRSGDVSFFHCVFVFYQLIFVIMNYIYICIYLINWIVLRNATIQSNPEIMEDVQGERARVQKQHHNDFNNTSTTFDRGDKSSSQRLDSNNTSTIYNVKEIALEVIEQIKSDITKLISFLTPSPEVQQMLREQQVKLRKFYKQHIIPTMKDEVIPALKSLTVVIMDWGITVVDMTRRYIQATFIDKREQGRDDGDNNDGGNDVPLPNRNNEH